MTKLAIVGAALIITGIAMAVNAEERQGDLMTEVTSGVFITLTSEPCTRYESPPNVILLKAYAVDKTINKEAEGCFSKEDDGTVVINLVNTTNNKQYGYVLSLSIFKPKYTL